MKKLFKRALSLLLSMVIMLTTFCFFDIGSVISDALVDVERLVNTVEPTVKFYVPETIYLNPVTNGTSKPYSFQYYIDCTTDGVLNASATQTTGLIFFNCSQACDSISISCDSTTTVTKTQLTSTSQILSYKITGGSTSVAYDKVKFTCTYVVGGVTSMPMLIPLCIIPIWIF